MGGPIPNVALRNIDTMSKIFEALQRAQQAGNPTEQTTPQAPPPEAEASSPLWDDAPPDGAQAPAASVGLFEDTPVSTPSPALFDSAAPQAFPGAAPPPSAPAYNPFGVPANPYVQPGQAPNPYAPPYGAPPQPPMSGFTPPAQVVPSLPLPTQVENQPAAWEPPSLVRFSPRSKVVVAQNPTSLAAEQYRVLRTNIIKLSQTQALKVILVTSPGPGDGKTLTAMNLALSFCQKPETRVLLIEADLRKPSVGALVAMNPGPGLSDYLAGEATLEHVVRPTSIPNFHLLDSGKRAAMPADLLHSPRLGNMMEVLRSHFNWIVLDGPPTNPVADYELLTPICDGVVLVVRPYYTQRDLLRLTTEALRGRKVLGCVINGSKHFERYGSAYGYGYGYGPGNEAYVTSMSQKRRMRRKRVTKEE